MSRFLVTFALALASPPLLLGQGGKQTPEQKALVQKVFDAWKQRREQFKSVRYKAKGERLMLKETNFLPANDLGRKTGWYPKQDKRFAREISLLLDLAGSRHRMDTKESLSNPTEEDSVTERRIVSAYDGNQLVQGNLRDPAQVRRSAHDIVITTGNMRGNGFTVPDWPPFMAHGIIPTGSAHLLAGNFDVKPDQKETYYHGTGRHQERECLVLRTELDHFAGRAFDEFWVDMRRGGAVLRYAWYVDGKLAYDLDMRYGDEAGWPLAGWTFTMQENGKTSQVHEMRVESCERDAVADADSFKVRLAAGTKVLRLVKGGNPDSFSPPPSKSEETFIVGEDGYVEPRATTGWAWWWGGAAMLLIVAVGAWILARRRSAA
ncbi:MAG: hypothetical protein K2W96_14140 [Gemmataceae bacterium]|nr:hypothetical protein [Gemmataceae bacterium]